jgi:hypothetical protein
MIVNNLNQVGVVFVPFEADSILPIYPDTVLTFSIAPKFLQPVSKRREVREAGSPIQDRKDVFGTILNRLEFPAKATVKYFLRLLIPARSNHIRKAYYATRIAIGCYP